MHRKRPFPFPFSRSPNDFRSESSEVAYKIVIAVKKGGERQDKKKTGESIKPVITIYERNIYGLSFRKLPRDYRSFRGFMQS